MKRLLILLFITLQHCLWSQQQVIVLGVAQDGGFPHIGCKNECQLAYQDPSLAKYVVSLALIEPSSKKWWLFEATPDMDKQLQLFQELTNEEYPFLPEGIFLTHAHIGHYTGLMYLGREALGAKQVEVYTLPKMQNFLAENGPWNQLVALENIVLKKLQTNQTLSLSKKIDIQTFEVPHRDEYSETAGFRINTEGCSFLFIPDINKWGKWGTSIVEQVKKVDHAFLDASFYKEGELPNRPMSEVPHPFVTETMKLFDSETRSVKQRVVFIHMNHTNPLLFDKKVKEEVLEKGFRTAEQGQFY